MNGAKPSHDMCGAFAHVVLILCTYCVEGLNETPLPTLLLHRVLCIDLQPELVGIGVDMFEDVSHGMLVRNPVFLT